MIIYWGSSLHAQSNSVLFTPENHLSLGRWREDHILLIKTNHEPHLCFLLKNRSTQSSLLSLDVSYTVYEFLLSFQIFVQCLCWWFNRPQWRLCRYHVRAVFRGPNSVVASLQSIRWRLDWFSLISVHCEDQLADVVSDGLTEWLSIKLPCESCITVILKMYWSLC